MQTRSFFWKQGQCRKIRLLLWDYASNRISEGPLERVEQHLADCEACRTELASLAHAQKLLSSARRNPPPAPRSDWHALRTRLQALPVPMIQERRRTPVWRPALQAATLALLFAGIGSGTTYLVASLSSSVPARPQVSSPPSRSSDTDSPVSGTDLQRGLVNAVMNAQPIQLQDPAVSPEVASHNLNMREGKPSGRTNFSVMPHLKRNDLLIPVQRIPGPVRPDDSIPHFKHYTPQSNDAPRLVENADPKPGPYEPVDMPVFQADSHEGEQPF